ncbi:MAG: hypothetical protein PHQ66_02485 [Candidatus Nanoarchaeia archaeon]|nr:hypothetical protein [Candidatus Nanoarchaeia archaeon]MDD5357765.1 hypothetical protein [Candidatus Nanoarchaeia archaeon]MDD5588684.1 hypothetical protein [Candidatus Nanoarchaeia archaeon]
MKPKAKKFKAHACAFRNEAECEEDLEEAGSNLDEAEDEFFDD